MARKIKTKSKHRSDLGEGLQNGEWEGLGSEGVKVVLEVLKVAETQSLHQRGRKLTQCSFPVSTVTLLPALCRALSNKSKYYLTKPILGMPFK